MIYIVLTILAALLITGVVFASLPRFGRLPRGERLERIRRSPNYRDGEFVNLRPTTLMTSDKGRFESFVNFLFSDKSGTRPKGAVESIRTDLVGLPKDSDLMVWFGHSSYLLQLQGRRILVDPVFHMAAPVSFVNRPFAGTDIYTADDMPDIDYLIITHDHWDHLDYHTVKRLKDRVGRVVCPLGVGEHFEYWGFDKERIVELDWQQSVELDPGYTIHCLPARHFSGRGLTSNQTLWASFLINSPSGTVYMSGDTGYGTHFAEIGKQYPNIDLAILENGQYNSDWSNIHIMPTHLGSAARDLKAARVVTVHHSKYALARHPWDEPLNNEIREAVDAPFELMVPVIGQVCSIE